MYKPKKLNEDYDMDLKANVGLPPLPSVRRPGVDSQTRKSY